MSGTLVAGVAVSPEHFIGGRRVASAARFEDRSPIDEHVLAEVARGGEAEVGLAVEAAAQAFPGWAALGARGRAEHLRRLADLIDANVDRIASVECLDMAMLERSLRARVIPRGARNYRSYAELAEAYEERLWSSNGTANRVLRMPSGPAAVVTPWNAPFMLSTWKTAPALAGGSTVVLKPPEWAPLSCSLLADLTDEAGFPPGVFNVVQGIGEEAGAALVGDAGVRRVSFTGSSETGRLVAMAAARNLVPFTAELGGKGRSSSLPTRISTLPPRRRPSSTTIPARTAWRARDFSSRSPSPGSSSSAFTGRSIVRCSATRGMRPRRSRRSSTVSTWHVWRASSSARGPTGIG